MGEGSKRERRLQPRSSLTLQFLSSGVVSSNSSPSLKLISVFLKVLWVLITTLSPSLLIITVGLVTFPTCRVANPTPRPFKEKKKYIKLRDFLLFVFFHISKYRDLSPRSTAVSYPRETLLSASLVPLYLEYPSLVPPAEAPRPRSPPSTAAPHSARGHTHGRDRFRCSEFQFLITPA